MSTQKGPQEQTLLKCPLLLLPPEAVEHGICQHLSLVDRIRLLSTCKQLWGNARLRCSPVLWGSVTGDLRSAAQAESFVSWLATKRDLVVSLSMSSRHMDVEDWMPWDELHSEVFRCMEKALSDLAGGPLQRLRLEPSGMAEVLSPMLSQLPNLQSLILILDQEADLALGADFSRLTALTELALMVGVVNSARLEMGSFPAGLRRLSLDCSPDVVTETKFNLALWGVQSLQELHLSGPGLGAYLGSKRLGSVTRLTLNIEPDMEDVSVPAKVTALTNLQHLDMQSTGCYYDGAYSAPSGALAPLEWLTQLTFLSLSNWELVDWPAELQGLPHLKSLDLLRNSLPAPLPDWAVWGQLEALGIDLRLAACSLQQLGRLTSLTYLELGPAYTSCPGYSSVDAALVRVLDAAGDLPRLQALNLDPLGGPEVDRALQQLSGQKPWLVINGVSPLEPSDLSYRRLSLREDEYSWCA